VHTGKGYNIMKNISKIMRLQLWLLFIPLINYSIMFIWLFLVHKYFNGKIMVILKTILFMGVSVNFCIPIYFLQQYLANIIPSAGWYNGQIAIYFMSVIAMSSIILCEKSCFEQPPDNIDRRHLKPIKISTQLYILFIPIINYSILIIWYINAKRTNINTTRRTVVYILIAFALMVPLMILVQFWDYSNAELHNLVGMISIYFYSVILNSAVILSEKLYGMK
jgi:hypothetical protein